MFNKNAFKIQLQTKLKQFTALALSTALVLTSISITSPLTAYATEDDGGSSGFQDSAENGGDKTSGTSQNQAQEVGVSINGADIF